MKSLNQHIDEKLRVNKDYEGPFQQFIASWDDPNGPYKKFLMKNSKGGAVLIADVALVIQDKMPHDSGMMFRRELMQSLDHISRNDAWELIDNNADANKALVIDEKTATSRKILRNEITSLIEEYIHDEYPILIDVDIRYNSEYSWIVYEVDDIYIMSLYNAEDGYSHGLITVGKK